MRFFLTLVPLAIVIASPAWSDDLMTGRWYTEGVEGDLHIQSVVDNNPDGTFVKTIRNGTDCNAISSWIEAGTWTFDGTQYVENTETVGGDKIDTKLGQYKDAFAVARVDETHVTLTDVKTDISWTFTKVAPNYAMSPPKDCTV